MGITLSLYLLGGSDGEGGWKRKPMRGGNDASADWAELGLRRALRPRRCGRSHPCRRRGRHRLRGKLSWRRHYRPRP